MKNSGSSCENIDLLDEPIENSIRKYKNHPSIIKIFDARKNTQVFNFNQVEETEIGKEIKLLDARKASTSTDTPVPIIKDNQEIFEKFLTCNFNNMIEKSIFPTQLKLAEVKPIFKKGSKLDMTNYRPVSILPTISYKKYMSVVCIDKYLHILNTIYQSINVDSGKALVHNIL